MGYQIRCMFVVILVTTGQICLAARSEFSRPDGTEHKIPLLESMLTKRGYPIETHEVITADDYILTVFRLPHPNSDKAPVFLQHGILAASSVYLASTRGLPLHLYDRGYDVWVGNSRGTCFSMRHKTLTHKDNQYWDFSFHEMGVFDVPAVLDHILATTGRPKIHYVGMSMGTTIFLVMATSKPQYLEHIHSITLMAPVARPKHMKSIITDTKRNMNNLIVFVAPAFGIHGIKYRKWFGKFLQTNCASKGTILGKLCEDVVKGKGLKGADYELEVAVDAYWWTPGGVSLKCYRHFIQIAAAGKFQQFDYHKGNWNKYGKNKPPEYALSQITKRIYLLLGGEDTIAARQDVEWLHEKLRGSWLITEGFEDFKHRTFNFAYKMEKVHNTIEAIIQAAEDGVEPGIKASSVTPLGN